MCKQYLCFVCDQPLVGNGFFRQCTSNFDARPPWLEPWNPTRNCPRPIYKYCNHCHETCRATRLQLEAEIQRQLGIAAVNRRADGSIEWHRSPDAVQLEAEWDVPQAKVQLISQWHRTVQLSHPEDTHEAAVAPTQGRITIPQSGTDNLFPNNSSMLPAVPLTSHTLPMPATGPRVPMTSVAPTVRDAPQRTADSTCDSCKTKHRYCDRLLPSCGQCAMRLAPCTRNELYKRSTKRPAKDPASAAQPKRRKRRAPLMNSLDTGTGLGANESSPTMPTFMGNISHGSSQTGTLLRSHPSHSYPLEPENHSSTVIDTFGGQDRVPTTFGDDDDPDGWRAYFASGRRGGDMGGEDDHEGSGHQESSDFEPGAEEGGEDDVLDS